MPPKSDGILESSLYVSDVARSVRFYEETFGFRVDPGVWQTWLRDAGRHAPGAAAV